MNFFNAIGRLPWSERIGLLILIFFAMCILFAPWIAPYGESQIVGDVWEPIGGTFLFGTDQIGRDLFRLLPIVLTVVSKRVHGDRTRRARAQYSIAY